MNSGSDTAFRSRGLRYSAAAGDDFGIEAVKSVRRDPVQPDLVHVELQFFPRDRVLPQALENPAGVTATLDDVVGTRLKVRAVGVKDDLLTVTVVAGSGIKRFRLRLRGLIAGLDAVEVSLQDEDPPFDPGTPAAATELREPPVLVDYRAKDFLSFKQLMLDSISHKLPTFTERHQADVGIAIIEVLAFAADQLSYFQDAVGTEAYLQTARRRLSVRRHARLVGYRLHEGCTPRVWLHVRPKKAFRLKRGTAFSTATGESAPERVFETLAPVALDPGLNDLLLWDNETDDFSLSEGATSADLVCEHDGSPDLSTLLVKGTVLVFEQLLDPATARKASARYRHAVRLSRDAISRAWRGKQLIRIDWHIADRLPFNLPVRTIAEKPVSVVRGNIVPADHGETRLLEEPPPLDSTWAIRTTAIPELTFAVPFDPAAERDRPASLFTAIKPHKAEPQIHIRGTALDATMKWRAQRDLIGADPYDAVFTVELERDGLAVLRFGDGVHGWRPDPGSRFEVTYRAGNGLAGQVGADTITVIRTSEALIESVRNPLAADGGEQPLDAVKAKREATEMIRDQKRCVADDDYLRVARSVPGVRAASVARRWTGTGPMVDVYVDVGGNAAKQRDEVRAALEAERLIGVQVTVRAPRRVGVVIELSVRCAVSANASAIAQGVAATVQTTLLAQRLTLGKPLFASWLLAAALKVPGVVDAALKTFRREDGEDRLIAGFIAFGPTEVPVLVDLDGIATGGRPLVEIERA